MFFIPIAGTLSKRRTLKNSVTTETQPTTGKKVDTKIGNDMIQDGEETAVQKRMLHKPRRLLRFFSLQYQAMRLSWGEITLPWVIWWLFDWSHSMEYCSRYRACGVIFLAEVQGTGELQINAAPQSPHPLGLPHSIMQSAKIKAEVDLLDKIYERIATYTLPTDVQVVASRHYSVECSASEGNR